MPVSADARANHEDFGRKFFIAVDSFNTDAFMQLFPVDGTFTMGNNPASVGHDQIRALVDGMFSILAGIKHEMVGLHSVDDNLFIIEGKVYYTIHSGTTLDAIPFSSTFELTADGQKIQNYRAYVDASPLFAALVPK